MSIIQGGGSVDPYKDFSQGTGKFIDQTKVGTDNKFNPNETIQLMGNLHKSKVHVVAPDPEKSTSALKQRGVSHQKPKSIQTDRFLIDHLSKEEISKLTPENLNKLEKTLKKFKSNPWNHAFHGGQVKRAKGLLEQIGEVKALEKLLSDTVTTKISALAKADFDPELFEGILMLAGTNKETANSHVDNLGKGEIHFSEAMEDISGEKLEAHAQVLVFVAAKNKNTDFFTKLEQRLKTPSPENEDKARYEKETHAFRTALLVLDNSNISPEPDENFGRAPGEALEDWERRNS